MPEQQILWTALPRRAEQTTLEIDVLVSPRLGVNAPPASERQLSDFAGLTHWTRTLSDHLTFEVELEDGTRHDAVVLPVATLDHVVWDHLFPATTFVRPWSFQDLSTRPLYSYSTRYVTAYLKDLYVDIGRRFPTQPPQRGELDPFRRAVGPVTDVRVEKERLTAPRGTRHPPPPRRRAPRHLSRATGLSRLVLQVPAVAARPPPGGVEVPARASPLRTAHARQGAQRPAETDGTAAGPDEAQGHDAEDRLPVAIHGEAPHRAAAARPPRGSRATHERRARARPGPGRPP